MKKKKKKKREIERERERFQAGEDRHDVYCLVKSEL